MRNRTPHLSPVLFAALVLVAAATTLVGQPAARPASVAAARSAQSLQPGRPAQSPHPAPSGQSPQPTRSAQPARPAKPPQPTRSARSPQPADSAQPAAWTPFIGGSVVLAAIPEPFAPSCAEVDGAQGGLGVQGHVGVRSGRGWDLRARYTGLREAAPEVCVLAPRTEPDGVHRRRTYGNDLWREGMRTIDVQVGFTPPPLRFLRVAIGAGVEADRGVPLVLGGAGLQFGSRVQFVAGADVLLLRTPYIIVEEEWRDARIIRSSQVDKGEVWRRSWVFLLGLEVPIGRR